MRWQLEILSNRWAIFYFVSILQRCELSLDRNRSIRNGGAD
jgi:hypothetical protein